MENRYTKNIINFEGYSITSTGKVIGKRGQELSQQENKQGYKFVSLYKDGKLYNRYIHRLIYEAFVKPIEKGLSIDHIDENKLNNRIENLQELKQIQNLQKFYDIEVNRKIEGYEQIVEFPNYYINIDGNVLSFKYGKSNEYKGKIIYSKNDIVFLRRDNKRYAISIRALLNKYFNSNIKLLDKVYSNII